MPSHLFLVHGDIMLIACDAWLLPGGGECAPGQTWQNGVGAAPLDPPPERWGAPGSRVIRWTPCRPNDPQPWLVNLWGSPTTPISWYVDAAREFLATAANHLAGTKPRSGRARHLLALPLVGTGQGGKRLEAGAVAVQLLPALYDFTERSEIDVALVMIEGETYSAVQAERRELSRHAWDELDPKFIERADALATLAARGELVLFIGAGVSAAAGVPLWGELLDEVAREQARMPDPIRAQLAQLSPLDRAHVLQRRLGEARPLKQTIADFVRTRSAHYALEHALLAALPIEAAVTTNYDTLFERASSAASRPVGVLPYERVREDQRWLLKLHGSVEHPDDIVLTRDDYMAYRERREALAGIVQALLITRHMLFVGFSLEDDNFHQIMRSVRRAVRVNAPDPREREAPRPRPFGTSLIIEANPLVEELWRDDLDWVHLGSENRADAPAAARRLEIFLDRVAANALNASVHLFDPRYANVLSDGEKEVRDLLDRLYVAASPAARESQAWIEIEKLLARLGRKARR
jgi:SIR2-like protein